MNTPTWTFQDRLRKAREHVGMTQSDLATATGVSLNSLNRYEKGQRTPSKDVVQAIATATAISLEWFYQDDPQQAPQALASGAQRLIIDLTPDGMKVTPSSG